MYSLKLLHIISQNIKDAQIKAASMSFWIAGCKTIWVVYIEEEGID
jgi:hypothetical protein